MSEINMLMTVTKRSVGRRLLACYEEIGLSSTLCTLAAGDGNQRDTGLLRS